MKHHSGSGDPRFVRATEAFAHDREVTHNDKEGFGSGALKLNGKIFAMMSSKGQFVLKLPKERVDDLVASGQGEHSDAGHGRLMKEWVVITGTRTPWIDLAKEAYRFAKGRKT
jgi:hypothetical protein